MSTEEDVLERRIKSSMSGLERVFAVGDYLIARATADLFGNDPAPAAARFRNLELLAHEVAALDLACTAMTGFPCNRHANLYRHLAASAGAQDLLSSLVVA